MYHSQNTGDITTLERVQHIRIYIYIYTSSRLLQLNLLPLMYIYELNDLMFLIKSLNMPTENFDIKDFISFNASNTRSGSHLKLCHPRALSTNHHYFYFNRIVRLWNHMPVIDISLPSHVIKRNLTNIYGIISQLILILTNLVHTTTSVHATDAQNSQSHPTTSI